MTTTITCRFANALGSSPSRVESPQHLKSRFRYLPRLSSSAASACKFPAPAVAAPSSSLYLLLMAESRLHCANGHGVVRKGKALQALTSCGTPTCTFTCSRGISEATDTSASALVSHSTVTVPDSACTTAPRRARLHDGLDTGSREFSRRRSSRLYLQIMQFAMLGTLSKTLTRDGGHSRAAQCHQPRAAGDTLAVLLRCVCRLRQIARQQRSRRLALRSWLTSAASVIDPRVKEEGRISCVQAIRRVAALLRGQGITIRTFHCNRRLRSLCRQLLLADPVLDAAFRRHLCRGERYTANSQLPAATQPSLSTTAPPSSRFVGARVEVKDVGAASSK